MATAVAMVRLAADHGTGVMVATPHAIPGLYATTRDQVLQGLAALRGACADLPVRLLPGQEIALVPDIAARVQAGEYCSLGDTGRAVLVEMPSSGFPPFWEQVFFELALAGLTPVVAHAERTPLLHDPALASRVVELGGSLQVNAVALAGGASRTIAAWLRSGWVSCLGSDGHDLRRRATVLDPALQSPHRPLLESVLCDPAPLRGV